MPAQTEEADSILDMMDQGTKVSHRLRFVKRVNGRGIITIPRDICEALGVQAGDILEIQVVQVLRRLPSVSLLPRPADPDGLRMSEVVSLVIPTND